VASVGDQESPISKAFNEDNRISHRLRRKKRLLLTTSEGEKIEWDNIIPENIQIIKSKNIPKFKRRDWKNWEVLNLEKGVYQRFVVYYKHSFKFKDLDANIDLN